MNADKLSNYQLFKIIGNKRLDSEIRIVAKTELNVRRLSSEEIETLINTTASKYSNADKESLSIIYKLIAMLIPFLWVVHILLTSRYLAHGKVKKWNEYWRYFCLGLVVWAMIAILIGRYSTK